MKSFRNEKGAITILVLVSILFMVSFLITSYIITANKVQTQKEIIQEILIKGMVDYHSKTCFHFPYLSIIS